MDALPILQKDEPLLRAVAKDVPEELFGTDELAKIVAQMDATLDKEADGVALAAPQVGIPYRIFIVRFDRCVPTPPEGTPAPAPVRELGVFCNPQFIKSSRRRDDMDEGCLSVRGLYGTTYRHERATVRARDTQGKTFDRGGGGLIAQIYQHETDHLNGILFIDHAYDIVEYKKKREISHDTEPA